MTMKLEDACREQLASVRAPFAERSVHAVAAGSQVLSSWVSGFHALALRQLDRGAALSELESVYALGQFPDGLLASEIRLPGAELPKEAEAAYENGRSRFLAPPIAAYAVGVLAQDRDVDAAGLLECATRELDAIWAERLPPETPLPVLLHPLESGLRYNPLFEELCDCSDAEEWESELASLARSALACRLNPATALRAGHAFVIEDPGFCGWLLVALEELERAWELRGQSATALKLRVRSAMIREAIEERLWWEDEEIYTAYNRGRQESLHARCASGLVPAAARGLIDEGSAKRAIDRHLRPSGSALWTAKGLVLASLPGGLRDEATLAPGRILVPAVQYWGHLALVRSGRLADARVLRAQLEGLLEAQGFQGGYRPMSGTPAEEPVCGTAVATVALDMRARDEGA